MGKFDLKGFNSVFSSTLNNEIQDNIIEFLDWALLEKGNYFNVPVGESSPNETNCSVQRVNLFPEVGITELFKLFLDVLAIKLTNVFSAGHEPSFGLNPMQIISLTLPVVGVKSP